MTSRVQSRKTPPVLVPLASPEKLSNARIHQRIKLIQNYAEFHRELDITEVRELFDLRYLLEHGTLPPAGGGAKPLKKYQPQLEDLLA